MPGVQEREIARLSWCLEPDPGALLDLLLDRPGQRADLVVSGPDGFVIADLHDGTGYLDALAVHPDARRRGVATRLVREAEQRLRTLGAHRIWVGRHLWHYAWPGVDERYTGALALFDRLGYHREGTAENMTVALARLPAEPPVPPGWTVRRAGGDDAVDLDTFLAREFTATWRHEAAWALERPVPPVFVAYQDGRMAGFACHGVYRADWFGPIGTAEAARGLGIGRILLLRCLADLRAAGRTEADIAWIGPARFYARTVGARPGRRFVTSAKMDL